MTYGESTKDRNPDGSWVTIGDVRVTASLEETHAIEGETTDYTVEDEPDRSDDYQMKPTELTIVGKISNVKLATGYPGATAVDQFRTSRDQDPAVEAWQTVKKYAKEKKRITIVTSLDTYENMYIRSFKVTRSFAKGGSATLNFTCSAKKVNTTTSENTAAIDLPEPQDDSAKTKKGNKGKKGTKKGNDAQEDRAKQSMAKSLGALF